MVRGKMECVRLGTVVESQKLPKTIRNKAEEKEEKTKQEKSKAGDQRGLSWKRSPFFHPTLSSLSLNFELTGVTLS